MRWTLGACSSQGMAFSNKNMNQQTAKAGARQTIWQESEGF